jgi:uncharacterized protein YycO
MRLVLPKWLLNFISRVYVSPRPLWISYNPAHHKLKGREIRRVLESLHKGDIMLRRWDGYLNTIFTPGFWAHAGLYVGNNKAIHALGRGVVLEDILDFCRADSLAIMRPKKNDPDKAVETAFKLLGKEYDYEFESNDDQFYCTELCDVCHDRIFREDYRSMAGNSILSPDAVRESEKAELVLEIKH